MFSETHASGTHYSTYVLGSFFVFIVCSWVFQIIRSPLRHVPGPVFARFTRLWDVYMVKTIDYPQYNIALHRKHGPIVRLAPNRYSLLHEEATKVVLGHKNSLNKSTFYDSFASPGVINLFSEKNNAFHATMRRPMAQFYSQTSLLGYEPAVDACNRILLKRIQEHSTSKENFDVRDSMQQYTFDVIGEITVGSRFGLMEKNGDQNNIIGALEGAIRYSTYVGLLPELHPWIYKVSRMLGLKSGFERVEEFISLQIENRVSGKTQSPQDRSDFLDKMLPLELEGKATRQHTWIACGQNIAAGSDTTAISLTSVIGFLATNPAALARLRFEIDEAIAQGSLSNPATFKQANALPYLHAVINEALRLHPAVGFPLARVIGKDGANIAGHYFPPGTEVGVNAWAVHNDTAIFGPDASEFRPERWIGRTAEDRATMDRNMITFGSGPRTCIGKNISLMEMYKVIPQIVREFDFDVVPDEKTGKPWTNDTAWFSWQTLKCRVRQRV